jgi:hypothetical protein
MQTLMNYSGPPRRVLGTGVRSRLSPAVRILTTRNPLTAFKIGVDITNCYAPCRRRLEPEWTLHTVRPQATGFFLGGG